MLRGKFKKLIALTLAVSMIAAFTSCGGNDNTGTDETGSNVPEQSDEQKDNQTDDQTDDQNEPYDEKSEESGEKKDEQTDNKSDSNSNTSAPKPSKSQTPDAKKNPPKDDNSDYSVPIKSTLTKDDGNLLVLVNKEYTISRDYYPTDMVDIDGSLSTNQNLKVKRDAYTAYKEMLADAQKEGLNFCICSAYRSYELQESLYNNSLSQNGKAYTDKMFAYPGRSEHHTGYAIDVTSASMNWGLSQNYADYPDGAWIKKNCAKYGFIIRYPAGKEDITGYMYEPWHIRYVGVDVAEYITEEGITFEEYLGVA